MQTDPCNYYHRQGECGSYPTCQKNSNLARSCSNYVCPPTKVCKMDGDTPKCIDDVSKAGHVGYNTQSQQSPVNQQHSVSANNGEKPHLYPQIPKRGETTPRPNIYRPVNTGSVYPQSQYPGYPQSQYPGYPQQQGSYPNQQAYPQQAYPQQAYPQQAYPQQVYPQQAYPQQVRPQQGYPQQNYPQQRYPQGQYAGYPQGNNRQNPAYPPTPSQGTSISDKITSGLKNIGFVYIILKCIISRLISI